jgi:hypothetical protein
MPANATINGDGFRVYAWPGGHSDLHRQFNATEEARVLSVTSIRNLCGTPFQLVNWQISNVVNVATGQRKAEWRDYSKSKRGRLVKGYRKDGTFPGEFVTRMIGTRGGEDAISEVREYLKLSAEEPRDVAAVRGSVVHKMIELNILGGREAEGHAGRHRRRRRLRPGRDGQLLRDAAPGPVRGPGPGAPGLEPRGRVCRQRRRPDVVPRRLGRGPRRR